MGLTRTAIRRPLATLMVFLALVLLGTQAYTRMRVDRFPQITFPIVFVQIDWAGASPDSVEQQIIIPAENTLSGLQGLQRIDATALQGSARLTLTFADGLDVNQTAIDTQRQISQIARTLPVDASQPSVIKADPAAIPVMNVVLTGTMSPDDMYDLAANHLAQQLGAVAGVASVQVSGGFQRQIQVQVDYDKLDAYGLSLAQVSNAVQRENIDAPGGNVDVDSQTYSVRAIGLAQAPEDIGEYVVATTPQGVVRIRDVAKVIVSHARPTSQVRYSTPENPGVTSVAMVITKQSDANTLQTAAAVRSALQQIQRTLPSTVHLTVTNDTSRFVRYAIDAVQKDLLLAILITGIVLFLFLHTWRSTFIVLISIPTCLVSTFLLMYALGFSLDTISLMAMALMIGILVDDSIVVLENTTRHLGMGESPVEAALNGRGEIGMAAIAITLIDVVVYVPISFMQGTIGKLFQEFGLTIACATLLSLMVSFTLVPMLASRWLKAHVEEGHEKGFAGVWERGFDRLAHSYRRLLRWALHHRPYVVAGAFGLLVLSILPLPLNMIGQEYAPAEDDGQFTISTLMPPGTSLAANSAAMAKLEEGLLKLPEVDSFTTTVGAGSSRQGGTDRNGQIAVQLVEKTQRQRSIFDVVADVRKLQADIPGMQLRTSVAAPLIGGGGGVAVNIRVVGQNPTTLQRIAEQVEQVVRDTPGTVDIYNDADNTQPEIRAMVDRKRMADVGVTASQVASALRTAIAGATGTAVTNLQVEGQIGIPIVTIASDDIRNDLTRLANIPIPLGSTGQTTGAAPAVGSNVRLGQVATLTKVMAPTQITRSSRQRQVNIQANLDGRSVGDAARDIRAGLAKITFPPGYRYFFVGQVDSLDQARTALLSALSISILLIYMLLVALYESWLHPLAIMFALPVALTGAFGALLLTHNTFNLFSMIGMIMLMGLVAKNGILLVDYTNTLRTRGLAVYDALLEAGPTRLRPIVMTTCTMTFSMIPLALKMEEGAESRAPMATVLLGGLLTSTLLTLVLVPVMYTYLDQLGRLPALARATVPVWLHMREWGSLRRRFLTRPRVDEAEPPQPQEP
ncbi:MAG TPA: efflux RND transporter permease subunit [Chloroflexota bacterium]|jgi:HAE1 family hydrophobic/amphiphilic exporter-1